MIFRQLFDSESSTYTYLLADEASGQAMLIDPVFEHHARDAALIRELGLQLVMTLDTHLHADHVTGAWLMKEALGSKIALSARYGAENVDVALDHGEGVQLGDKAIEVRATPGHTAGCLTYVVGGELAFTGDALLIRGAGRTDFQEGDARTLYHSIREQILSLPSDCLIYPAHDYAGRTVTTVSEELAFNARIGGDANENDFVGYMTNLGLAHPKKIDEALPANFRCGRPEAATEVDHFGPVFLTYAGIPQISADWVSDHLEEVRVLDVRDADELAEGQVPGALHIPLGELRERLDELSDDKPIVTICRSGRRSAQATVILRKAGHESANVGGGMIEWMGAGFPLESVG